MIKNYIYIVLLCFIADNSFSQVGIGNINPQSILDISASSTANPTETDGLLIPRLEKFPDVNPGISQDGMIVFLSQTDGNDTKGFYFWDNDIPDWIPFGGEWLDGENALGQQLIYAKQADANGTRMVFTDDGRIGIGTDTPVERFEFKGPGDNDFQITSANTNPPNLIFYNTGGSLDAPNTLAANGEIGSVIFKTHDGDQITEVGGFRLYLDGAASDNSTPSRFVVNTTPIGSVSQQVRMSIREDGDLGLNKLEPDAILDVNPVNANTPKETDGILIPRLNALPNTNPGAAQHSMLIYLTQEDNNYNEGFLYWDNNASSWKQLLTENTTQIMLRTNPTTIGNVNTAFNFSQESFNNITGSSYNTSNRRLTLPRGVYEVESNIRPNNETSTLNYIMRLNNTNEGTTATLTSPNSNTSQGSIPQIAVFEITATTGYIDFNVVADGNNNSNFNNFGDSSYLKIKKIN